LVCMFFLGRHPSVSPKGNQQKLVLDA
jgi:hypothetical protein